MYPMMLPDGRLLVPLRAEGADGMIGDGWQAIGPDHPEWADWHAEWTADQRMAPAALAAHYA